MIYISVLGELRSGLSRVGHATFWFFRLEYSILWQWFTGVTSLCSIPSVRELRYTFCRPTVNTLGPPQILTKRLEITQSNPHSCTVAAESLVRLDFPRGKVGYGQKNIIDGRSDGSWSRDGPTLLRQ
jgi:hypothetical protein